MSTRTDQFLPMSEEMASFLQEIKADPDNNGLRLIFADWLEEHNDPRGPLMRAQCEPEHLPGWEPQRGQLQSREKELQQPLQQWLACLPSWVTDHRVERGLLRLGTFLEASSRDRLGHLIESEWGRWTEGLTPYFSGMQLSTFVNLPEMVHLTTLDLSYNIIGDLGARSLAASKYLDNLASLNLWSTSIGAAGAQALAYSKLMSNLTSLNLRRNYVGDVGAQALASSEQVSNLTSLDLRANNVGNVGAQALASSEYLDNVTFLDLGANTDINDRCALALYERFGDAVQLSVPRAAFE